MFEWITRQLSASRLPSQSLALQAIASSGKVFFRGLAQSLGVLAETFRTWTATRLTSQPLQMMFDVAGKLRAIRASSQLITVGRLAQVTGSFTRAFQQSLAVWAQVLRQFTVTRQTFQPLQMLPQAARQLTATRAPSQALDLQSLTQSFGVFLKQAHQSISATVQAMRAFTVTRGISQPLDVLTVSIREWTAARYVSDTFSIRAVTQSAGSFIRSITQPLGVLAQAIRSWIMARAAAQPIDAVARPARQWIATRTLQEPLRILGDAVQQLSALRSPSESISLMVGAEVFTFFNLFVEEVSQAVSIALRHAQSITRAVTPPHIVYPPFPPSFAYYSRMISEAISIKGRATGVQTLLRIVLQAVTSIPQVMRSITPSPPIFYQRITDAVVRLFSGSPTTIHTPVASQDEGKGFPGSIIMGLVIGLALTALIWYRRRVPERAGVPASGDRPPEEPPEPPPEPVPAPVA
jgi:hypothetical protein